MAITRVLNIGTQKRSDVRALRQGNGPLHDAINTQFGDEALTIVIVKEKARKKRKTGRDPIGIGIMTGLVGDLLDTAGKSTNRAGRQLRKRLRLR